MIDDGITLCGAIEHEVVRVTSGMCSPSFLMMRCDVAELNFKPRDSKLSSLDSGTCSRSRRLTDELQEPLNLQTIIARG